MVFVWNTSSVPPPWQTPTQPARPTLRDPLHGAHHQHLPTRLSFRHRGKHMPHFSPFPYGPPAWLRAGTQ